MSAVQDLVAALEASTPDWLRERGERVVAECARVWSYQETDADTAVLEYARTLLLEASQSPI